MVRERRITLISFLGFTRIDPSIFVLYISFYMTSNERHEARYQRRKERRFQKKRKYLNKYDDLSIAINRNALSKATRDASLSVSWKSSVKRFRYHKAINIKRQADLLLSGRSVHKNFICFSIFERGKQRKIMSVRFSERIVQKSVCQNILVPALTRSLIYENCANQKGKGTHLARQIVKDRLSWHYRRYGLDGYSLTIDFKSFFENLDHSAIKRMLSDTFTDSRLLNFLFSQLDDYAAFYGRPVGLGLGSEPNQIFAVSLPSPLDHYIKEKLGIHCYVRYMDDMILIHPSKLYLEECLSEIREVCGKYGFIINERKTQISKLSRGFTYLKTQYKITETGHIVMKPDRKSIARERRKLKKQAALFRAGKMTLGDISQSYASWKGSLLDRDSYRTLKRMDALYNQLFTIKEVKKYGN